MKLLLGRVRPTGICGCGGYAIVELGADDLRKLAARRKALLAAKADDDQLYEMWYWAHAATFYGDDKDIHTTGTGADFLSDLLGDDEMRALTDDEAVKLAESHAGPHRLRSAHRARERRLLVRLRQVRRHDHDHCGDSVGGAVVTAPLEGRAAVYLVTFERGDEDAEVAASRGRNGQQQLADELQEACDASGPNGTYKVHGEKLSRALDD